MAIRRLSMQWGSGLGRGAAAASRRLSALHEKLPKLQNLIEEEAGENSSRIDSEERETSSSPKKENKTDVSR